MSIYKIVTACRCKFSFSLRHTIFPRFSYIKQYQQSEDLFKTVLGLGQMFTDTKDPKAFGKEMKHTAKYLKKQVDDYKPIFDMAKNIYNLWSNSV